MFSSVSYFVNYVNSVEHFSVSAEIWNFISNKYRRILLSIVSEVEEWGGEIMIYFIVINNTFVVTNNWDVLLFLIKCNFKMDIVVLRDYYKVINFKEFGN